MPITYLDVPKGIRIEEKNKLVKAICAALHEAYPYPDDVRIFLREWRPDSVSQDGQLASEPVRPVFMMHVPEGLVDEPRLYAPLSAMARRARTRDPRASRKSSNFLTQPFFLWVSTPSWCWTSRIW